MEPIVIYAANLNSSGAAATMPQLCEMLAQKGLLTSSEIERLRHAALLGFDRIRQHKELSEDDIRFLEKARGHADTLWQKAALAAERQG